MNGFQSGHRINGLRGIDAHGTSIIAHMTSKSRAIDSLSDDEDTMSEACCKSFLLTIVAQTERFLHTGFKFLSMGFCSCPAIHKLFRGLGPAFGLAPLFCCFLAIGDGWKHGIHSGRNIGLAGHDKGVTE